MKKAFAAMFAFLSLLGCAQSPVREGGYAVDAAWPKPLPNNWTLGQVAGIAVDARDHVWVIHRPKTLIDGRWFLSYFSIGGTAPKVVAAGGDDTTGPIATAEKNP